MRKSKSGKTPERKKNFGLPNCNFESEKRRLIRFSALDTGRIQDRPDDRIGFQFFLIAVNCGGRTGGGQFLNRHSGVKHSFIVPFQKLERRRSVAENMGDAGIFPEKSGDIVWNRIGNSGIKTSLSAAGRQGVP